MQTGFNLQFIYAISSLTIDKFKYLSSLSSFFVTWIYTSTVFNISSTLAWILGMLSLSVLKYPEIINAVLISVLYIQLFKLVHI